MIKANDRITNACNKLMQEECDKYWQDVSTINGYPSPSLAKQYESLPDEQKAPFRTMHPCLPKEWKECEWGLFHRGDYETGYKTKADKWKGNYCPLDSDGKFMIQYGFANINCAWFYDDINEANIRVQYLNGLWWHALGWVLRCNEDFFLWIDDKPIQFKDKDRGICFKAHASLAQSLRHFWIYWEVLADSKVSTLCDWNRPFLVEMDWISKQDEKSHHACKKLILDNNYTQLMYIRDADYSCVGNAFVFVGRGGSALTTQDKEIEKWFV